jgi:hypothetical protein
VSNTTWIGNVFGVTAQSGTTAPVIVSDTGQLGTVVSSERFKKDISTMEKTSEAILALRPVTFHYRTDARNTPQFGLVAEEVAKVNAALVLADKEGKPYTVRYDVVNAMLLNEFLKERRKVEQLEKQIEALTAGLQKVNAQLEASKAGDADGSEQSLIAARFEQAMAEKQITRNDVLTASFKTVPILGNNWVNVDRVIDSKTARTLRQLAGQSGASTVTVLERSIELLSWPTKLMSTIVRLTTHGRWLAFSC